MTNQFITTKLDIVQNWDQSGRRIPTTLLQAEPMVITQLKTQAKHGYSAIQVGIGSKSLKKTSKPLKGHLKDLNQNNHLPKKLQEIRFETDEQLKSFKVGDSIQIDQVLSISDLVSATGVSKGKGFTGVIKRWNFKGGPRTHGQSDRERAPGSIGQGTSPGRVWKGKKMAGRHGNQTITVRNLTVVDIDSNQHTITLKGTVPGPIGRTITLTKTGTSPKETGLLNSSNQSKTNSSKKEPKPKKSDSSDQKSNTLKNQTDEKNPPKSDNQAKN